MKIVATQVLLKEYPELAKAGLQVGDDLQVTFMAAKKPNGNNPQTLDEDGEPDPPPPGGDHPKPPIIP